MKVITLSEFYTVELCRAHPEWLFLFGDNDVQRGCKGQALIRYQPNAMGIPTKKFPSYSKDAYYTDEEFEDNCRKIDTAIARVMSSSYETIVLPAAGLGTGLARLPEVAPLTYRYLCERLKFLATI
jgi:hypothetical protein